MICLATPFIPLGAQSELLQLNLLLEDDQELEWTEIYPVWLEGDIPAKITLGKLRSGNNLIGLFEVEDMSARLALHGVISEDQFLLFEWYDNAYQTGRLELNKTRRGINGFWYNVSGDRRFSLTERDKESLGGGIIRQYASTGKTIFTLQQGGDDEKLMEPAVIPREGWAERKTIRDCLAIPGDEGDIESFCRTGLLQLYNYDAVNLTHLLHGSIPQIPHDETFNAFVTLQLRKWEALLLSDSIDHIESDRWSKNQQIWFDPDYITDDIVSGLLSVQAVGSQIIHSVAIIYDRKQRKFYTPEDFFRGSTDWNRNFQENAKKHLYQSHQDVLDLFPEVFDQIHCHLTISAEGLMLSSDFTPYFGRLTYILDPEEYKDQAQKYAPYRQLLNLK